MKAEIRAADREFLKTLRQEKRVPGVVFDRNMGRRNNEETMLISVAKRDILPEIRTRCFRSRMYDLQIEGHKPMKVIPSSVLFEAGSKYSFIYII